MHDQRLFSVCFRLEIAISYVRDICLKFLVLGSINRDIK